MNSLLRYHIVTFGCAANIADSQRLAGMLERKGMKPAKNINQADYIVINTCMIRQSAENRVYGLINNLMKDNKTVRQLRRKIVLTGCMVGMAVRDKSNEMLKKLKEMMPIVDQFLPIEDVGFDNIPIQDNKIHAWVPISNGCNNFCSYCVVPYTRGREISRPLEDIIKEIKALTKKGFTEITLVGQNVNSYGNDLYKNQNSKGKSQNINSKVKIKPVYIKHLGRFRIPTLFPYLLEQICQIDGIKKIDFMSSNPWDFSDELIEVIKNNPKISRLLHLPVQSGDDNVLKRMNRWYTAKEYLALISKIRSQIPNIIFSTDIIVGFCGETETEFQNTIDLVKKVGFSKAYISQYSDRPETVAHKNFKDNVSPAEKKRRWKILDDLINQENLKKGTYPLDIYRKKSNITRR